MDREGMVSQRPRRLRRPFRPVYSGCDTCGEGASGRATLNGDARDRPGLVREGVGVLTSAIAARVEPKEVNGGGAAKQRQPGQFGRYRRYPLRQLPRAELN